MAVTRGFTGRRPTEAARLRLPPGQHQVQDFPVLSLGPTPRVDPATWRLDLWQGPRPVKSWSRAEFDALPRTSWRGDIHCVTTWSKFDTGWEGVTFDDLMGAAGIAPPTGHLLALGHDGYDTNLGVADLVNGQAMLADRYEGLPIEPDHGGPVRLLVPHLYFWKSAKWLKGLRFIEHDTGGYWELRGYHMRGDPWREERFEGD